MLPELIKVKVAGLNANETVMCSLLVNESMDWELEMLWDGRAGSEKVVVMLFGADVND